MKRKITIWNRFLKLRTISLVLFTTLPGFYLGSDNLPDKDIIVFTLIGLFFNVLASFFLNSIIQENEPIHFYKGHDIINFLESDYTKSYNLITGLSLSISSFYILYTYVNIGTAVLVFISLIYFLFISALLKNRNNEHDVVYKSGFIATGVLVGFTASNNLFPISSILLYLSVFFWMPPHHWSLFVSVKDEFYSNHQSLFPHVNELQKYTRLIVNYTILYSIFCILVGFFTDRIGNLYIVMNCIFSIISLFLAYRLHTLNTQNHARTFFIFSGVHLFCMISFILLDFKMTNY